MAIEAERIDELAALLLAVPAGGNPVPVVRASFPDLTVSRCDAADMRHETPYRRIGEFDVFLVDTSNHCWRMIDEPGVATGVILAAWS